MLKQYVKECIIMVEIKVFYVHKWYIKWGGIRMSSELTCKRPAYTNNEIVDLFNKKLIATGDSLDKVAQKYGVDIKIIEYMKDRVCEYNYKMLKIVSDYLDIPYNDLVAFVEDDQDLCSLRADNTEAANELNDVLNYLFNEIINQERIARV